jgi:hypothetical protein
MLLKPAANPSKSLNRLFFYARVPCPDCLFTSFPASYDKRTWFAGRTLILRGNMLTTLSGADLPTYLEDGTETSSLKYLKSVSLGNAGNAHFCVSWADALTRTETPLSTCRLLFADINHIATLSGLTSLNALK